MSAQKEPRTWIPAGRFLAAIDGNEPHHSTAAGRRTRELKSGRQQFVKLETADEIFVEAGLEYLWHVAAVDGGFADIYEDGAQYGCPSNKARVYGTEAERVAAFRRNWARSKRRARRIAEQAA